MEPRRPPQHFSFRGWQQWRWCGEARCSARRPPVGCPLLPQSQCYVCGCVFVVLIAAPQSLHLNMDNNTIIEGTVKFRDGKKWKSRWCVMRKLSPVADCVHLQLYRDSRDRYKQGQTKASLSLQHFLALETGFTLDKESNTMAIICQDVTVVLAFDTRERLIQWQVKIANNLGEDQQFLIQIVSAPPRAKIATGPARMHVQEHRFCLTTGFPPRLIGCWEISQLRRYGAVEKRFCFEGGSRCGRGEGVYVLATDQCDEISRTLQVAAQGKLATRRRPVTRNLSVMESPRRQLHSRAESDQESCVCSPSPFPSGWNPSDSLPWPSSETNTDVSDFGDAISMEYADTHSQSWQSERGLGRCVSCISKLGAPLSRSSTANTPGECRIPPSGPSSFVSFPSCESTTSTEYSTPRGKSITDSWMMHAHRHSSSTPIPDDTKRAFSPPARPPKPGHLPLSAFQTPPAKRTPLPMPMPFTCSCQHNAYNNYDVPRSIVSIKEDLRTPTYQPPGEYYDTPRSLRDSLQRPTSSLCHTPISHCCSRQVQQRPNMMCPCQRIVCCRESWMMPYSRCCSPDNPSEIPIQKARLSGTGKMPVNSNGNLAIYATVDKLKRLNCKDSNGGAHQVQSEEINNAETNNQETPHIVEPSANYVNIEPFTQQTSEQDKSVLTPKKKGNNDSQSTNANNVNYMNLDFAQSLQYYENAKDLRRKAGLDSETDILPENTNQSMCSKCGHSSQAINLNTSTAQSEDYLLMEPATSFHAPSVADSSSNSPIKSSETVFNPSVRQFKESAWLPEKSSSVPSLAEAKQEGSQKREAEFSRIADNISRVCQSQSAASSPYLRRHKMSYCPEDLRFRRATSVESSRNSEDSDNFKSVISRQSVCDSELSVKSVSENKNIELQIVEDGRDTKTEKTDSCSHQDNSESTDTSDSLSSVVNIRRSSSVPCKSVNRDSSSSNDSGVSTGSLNQRGTDFAEFELPLSGRRHHLSQRPATNSCLHSSLPRKSKSSDPLQELTFQFQKEITPKSSSAGAEVPVCSVKRNILKGCTSPDRPMVFNAIIDTHSTSSGTSDMSDYCETLSLSSYCSDTSEFLRFNHQAVTTLRPRSGKEYQKIDRSILESEIKKPLQQTTVDVHATQRLTPRN